jgi:hypothetical protein
MTASYGIFVGPKNATFYINFTASTGNILDVTHDNAMIAFQHIFDVTNVSNGCFNV